MKCIMYSVCIWLLTTLLVGCAAFPGRDLTKIEDYPRAQAATSASPLPTGKIELTWYSMDTPKPQVLEENWEMRDEIYNVAKQSGLFSSVGPFEKDPNYNIQVSIHNHGNFSMFLTVLSGLTLTVLPTYAKDVWDVTAIVSNSNGEVIQTYSYTDHVTTWIELLFVFATPFTARTAERTVVNIFKHLFAQMITDGIIVPVSPQPTVAPPPQASPQDVPAPPPPH
ncbi:MAG: hypothetical protein JXX14_21795 [Deltaproteobacteria bacterium]|nr:hypothetical protein [Deltaproteobacteria bacterium]